MAMNRKLCFTLFLVSVLVLCAALALATKDPELKQCKHQCRAQQQYDEKQKEQCTKKCERYYKEKKQREGERHGESEGEEEEEWGGRDEWMNPGEPAEKHLRQCQLQCDRQEGAQQKALCRFRCQEKYRREKEGEGRDNTRESEQEEELQDGEEEEEEEENPYVLIKKSAVLIS